MGCRTVRVNFNHNTITDGDHFRAAGRTKIQAEMKPLPGLIKDRPLDVRADSITVGLAEQPGIRAGGCGKGQAEWRRHGWLVRWVNGGKANVVELCPILGIYVRCDQEQQNQGKDES